MNTTLQQDSFDQLILPPHMQGSPLMKQGGFAVFEGLPAPSLLDGLLRESIGLLGRAQASRVSTPDSEEVRGGKPCRSLFSAPGGSLQDAFYNAGWVIDFLGSVTGLPVTTSGMRGTYSYYARPGDFLALHRDVEACDLVLITCLFDNAGPTGGGGLLRLYPQRALQPLSSIRSNPGQGAMELRLLAGQTLVMFGGVVPHEITSVADGQARIVSVLCYRV